MLTPSRTSNSTDTDTDTDPALDPYDVEVGLYNVDIRWTSYGIPHIKAEDYGSLGFGMGYALAKITFAHWRINWEGTWSGRCISKWRW